MAQAALCNTAATILKGSQPRQTSDQALLTVIGEVLIWIEANLNENLSLINVTKKSGYAHWYFQRKFRQITGVPLADYIRLRRIINAADQLIMTDKKILTIALDNGFSSQQAFTRIFRRYLIMTPGEIRRKHQGDSTCTQELWHKFYSDYAYFAIPTM